MKMAPLTQAKQAQLNKEGSLWFIVRALIFLYPIGPAHVIRCLIRIWRMNEWSETMM